MGRILPVDETSTPKSQIIGRLSDAEGLFVPGTAVEYD